MTWSFSFGASFPLLFIFPLHEIKNIAKYFDKEAATFRQSLLSACLLHVLDCYCFFIASTCNLTKRKMVWNFRHVWRKCSCRQALAWKAGAVQNKNSRLHKADFINQRFHRWTFLGCWSKKKNKLKAEEFWQLLREAVFRITV